MEKTAMQQLIEKLENFVKELDERFDGDPLVKRGVLVSIGEAKKLLPVDRQQIIDARRAQFPTNSVIGKIGEQWNEFYDKQASDYYTQKYGQ